MNARLPPALAHRCWPADEPLLDIEGLRVSFDTHHGPSLAVDGISLQVRTDEILAIVGESGSGKSVAMLAVMGLLPWKAHVQAERLRFAGQDLLDLTAGERRALIGREMAMVFQEPMSSLNPCFTVGWQVTEALAAHTPLTRRERHARMLDLLTQVGIPDPARRAMAFPHQLSGGMSQRVMIAMALACRPRLLIADEPTTALDVTIQAQIMDLLQTLRRDTGMALVLITHDLGLVAEVADQVVVQYAGHVVERQAAATLFTQAEHPYTRSLLAALPDAACVATPATCTESPAPSRASPPAPVPLLQARDLKRCYPVSRGWRREPAVVQALDGVSFELHAGRTLAVVGESGCGKSTLARVLTLIEPPDAGSLRWNGQEVSQADATLQRRLRSKVQIVFQNPYGSLNPRQTIGHALMEPLRAHGLGTAAQCETQARAMLARVGLRDEHFNRYPHMFSGGQRQRVAIARALMLQPQVLVLDEPVSALDVSIRAQILDLLKALQQSLGVAYVFISHDLSVVQHMADEVMVMYLGRCVEHASREALFLGPRHPYTQALLSATPMVDPSQRRKRILLHGELPSPIHRPTGCAFHTRCPVAEGRCATQAQVMHTSADDATSHAVACWKALR